MGGRYRKFKPLAVMRDKKDLYPYQKSVIKHIVKHPKSGLFLDMGLG